MSQTAPLPPRELESPDGAEVGTPQSRLARSLIRCLGHDEAVTACRANSWHGVLAIVLQQRRDSGAAMAF